MEEIREVPRGIKKKQKEVKLLKEHNTLEQHWGDIRTSNLNQPLSDFHCKYKTRPSSFSEVQHDIN